MKKRVRIYKSPTGEGQFLNKTAQFLRKAQMGGTPSPEELSYPGASQGQAQQVDDNQLASLVMEDISNSKPKEEIVVKLVNMYGKDPMEATNFVNQMYTYLEQQSEDAKEEDSEDTSDEEITSGDPEDAEEETVMAPVQEIEEGFYGDDVNNDMANEIVNEDEEVEDDDTDVASQMVMMRGGFMRAQEGAEVESEYPIVFPGVEAYLPANMSDMMGGSYDVATGEAWQRPDFKAPETSQDSGISYGSMDPGASAMIESGDEGIASEENYDESEFRKGGAYKKGKSAYVNSVLKLVKKQMGGDQASNDPNNLVKKADQADPTGNNVRRGILDNYIGTLKNQSQMAVAKEEAEKAYDQMMQQQQQQLNQPGVPMMNYPESMDSLDEAQFGGFFNRRRNQDGQERRGLFNRQPRIPQGFGYGYPPIESMDVRRSGIFGRPKEYSINFGQMPGSGAGGYGYTTTTKKTPARKIVEDEAIYVNSQANKDVAAVTPGNDATNKDVKVEEKVEVKPNGTTETVATTDVKTPGTETPVVVNSSQTAKEKQVNRDQVKGQKEVNVEKRADGLYSYPNKTAVYKKENNQWYIDPSGTGKSFQKVSSGDVENRVKALETNAVTYVQPKAKVKPVVPQVQRDQWGRPVGSSSYGFNTKTGKFEHGANEKQWKTKNGQQATSFESTYKTDFGAVKPARYQIVRDAKGRIIPEKSFAAVQQSEDYGGVIYVPWNEIPNRTGTKNEDNNDESWNNGYGGDMMAFGGATFQAGGSTNNLMPDQYGNLQKFVYGGDDPSLTPIDQSDIDYTGSEDVTDPYFQKGGWFNTLFPANVSSGYRTQYLGARNAAGQQVPGVLGQNAKIKSVNVTKTGLLGRPKKYSVTFSQDALNDAKQDNSPLPGNGAEASAKKQIPLSQREIDRGERQAGRQRPWHAGRRYENDFEEYELTPEEQKRYAANDARYEADLAAAKKLRMDEESILKKMSSPKIVQPGMTQNQMQDFQQMFGNTSGLPSYAESPAPTNAMRPQGKFPAGYIERNPKYGPVTDSYESYLDFINSGMPLEKGMTTTYMTRDQYADMYGHYRDGGALRRFIPTAQNGVNTPVDYTNNPAIQGSLVSFEPGIEGLQGGFDWTSISGPGTVTQQNADGTETYGVDASYKGPQYDPTVIQPNTQEDITYDFKTKRNMSNAAIQGSLLAGNAVAKGALGMIDRFQNKKNQKNMYKNLTADNIYGADTSRDRGDYDTNSGLYRPDEMGQTWNSRSKQYGGQNDYLNEDPDYVEGDEIDMTDEEIQDYLAKGGEIEYL